MLGHFEERGGEGKEEGGRVGGRKGKKSTPTIWMFHGCGKTSA